MLRCFGGFLPCFMCCNMCNLCLNGKAAVCNVLTSCLFMLIYSCKVAASYHAAWPGTPVHKSSSTTAVFQSHLANPYCFVWFVNCLAKTSSNKHMLPTYTLISTNPFCMPTACQLMHPGNHKPHRSSFRHLTRAAAGKQSTLQSAHRQHHAGDTGSR
jgi:hypothetical protein